MNYLFNHYYGVLVQFDCIDDDNSQLSEDGRDALGLITVGVPILAPEEMFTDRDVWQHPFVEQFIKLHWEKLENNKESNALLQDVLEVCDQETLQENQSFGTYTELKLTFEDAAAIYDSKKMPEKYMKALIANGYDPSLPFIFIAPRPEFIEGTPSENKKRK